MSTSLLYHAFGIRGPYEHVATHYVEGEVVFRIAQKRESLRCSQCGCRHVHVKTHETRTFRSVPIGGRTVFVQLPIARVQCQKCSVVRQVRVPFNKRFLTRMALESLATHAAAIR